MINRNRKWVLLPGILLVFEFSLAQEAGAISGTVLQQSGDPVHHATVMIVETGDTVETDHEGRYKFSGLPAGTFEVFAHAASFTSELRPAQVVPGEIATVNLVLQLSPIRQSITVTARGRHETTFEAIQSVTSLDTFSLAEKLAPSIGEVLDGQPGIAKRSFGPGSARPVIRGFDGDRVLVMKDGMRVGSLGSQSGDHGEPIDPGNLERLEVVKGPATLLYGSNAIGGVVNAISRHHEMHKHRHEGIRGQVAGAAGTNNGLGGGSVTAEYGTGDWVFWGGGGGQRVGDYSSPEGVVENSKARITNANAGLGWFNPKANVSFGYTLGEGRNGIPFADVLHGNHEHEESDFQFAPAEEHEEEEDDLKAVDLDWIQHGIRATGGFEDLGTFLSSVRLSLNVSSWEHNELEIMDDGTEQIGTAFNNDQIVYRADFDQDSYRALTGSFGLWGIHRSYDATGEEALSPPVDQNGFALFTLQEVDLERVRFQFGARVEHIRYHPKGAVERGNEHDHDYGDEEEPDTELVLLPERSFTGVSAGIGMRVPLWEDGAFVANYTNSYRAPSLEELYNYGPHVGNLAFEIGDPNLDGERSNGFDLSLRHAGERVSGEINFFYYSINNFIYAAPTGHVAHNLFEIMYEHGDSRFVGTEFQLDLGLTQQFWLNLGLDTVDANLTNGGASLPRIPPLRGRIGFDYRNRGFSLRPEVVLASNREDIFPTETPTAGYGVVNLNASYTFQQQHFVHHLSVSVFNIGDKLYRNHVSFIKDLAPEMGRGVKISYAMRFF